MPKLACLRKLRLNPKLNSNLIPMVTLNLEYDLDEVTIHKNTKKLISRSLYVTCK